MKTKQKQQKARTSGNDMASVRILMDYATTKFLGFIVPVNIASAYGLAKDAEDYGSIRRNLENTLVGFFRNSYVHFTKRVNGMKLVPALESRRQVIVGEIAFLRTTAEEKWIDLAKASETYFTVYAMIAQLQADQHAEQAKMASVMGRFNAVRDRLASMKFDADLLVTKKAIERGIELFKAGRSTMSVDEIVAAACKRGNAICDQQMDRLQDRTRATAALRGGQQTLATAA